MGRSKIRTLLMASVMIMLCAAMIVGGTYAMWSDEVRLGNHLVAGKLDVKLERISLTKTYLDNATGYLVTESNANVVDFSDSESTTENVFGIDELLVPGSAYEARLRLTNNGDVAFTYDVTVKLTSISGDLAEQLKVYVSYGDGDLEYKGTLSQYSTNGLAVVSRSAMTSADTAKVFIVRIEFDGDGTNAAQNDEATFDLLVTANQETNQTA